MSKTKNDMIYVLEKMNVSLVTKFCKNKEALWLLVNQVARFSQLS